MLPTVRDVLELDPVRRGAPRVAAGADALDTPVRWVHSAEVPDIATLLRGGELVLITGIGLPADDPGLRRFIADLAEVRAAGLVVELGRRFTGAVPRSMVAAARRHRLPLIELRRSTPFVQITEAVHALIVDVQLGELRATEEIHQRFTELSVTGAEPTEVVAQVAELGGGPVVLENLSRQVLAYHAAGDSAQLLLDGWEQYSRRIAPAGRGGYDPDAGWLAITVGARGQDWGRLLLRWPASGPAPGAPPTRLTILLERAAATLALDRLIRRDTEGRDPEALERQIHRTVLAGLLDQTRPVDELAVRAQALGVPLDRRRLIGIAIRHRPAAAVPGGVAGTEGGPEQARLRQRELVEAVLVALREAKLPALVGALDEQCVAALITLRSAAAEQAALDSLAGALRRTRADLIIAAGTGVDTPREAYRSLAEARQVANAARHDRQPVAVFRAPQVGLVGLLHLLRAEPRLQTFVERELAPLLAHDALHPKEQLLGVLRAYLDCGRNKSAAANAAHLSRPAFYERLARIGRILGADLESVESCLSLHVALLALDAVRDS
jgi:purine catabolism regulator